MSVIESLIFASLGECDDFQPTSINMLLTSSEVSSYLPCCSSFAAVCCVYRHHLDQRVLFGQCGNRQCLGLLDERGQTLHQQLTVLDCIPLSSLASSLHHQLLVRRLHTMGIERVHGDLRHHWLLTMLRGLGELVSGVRRNEHRSLELHQVLRRVVCRVAQHTHGSLPDVQRLIVRVSLVKVCFTPMRLIDLECCLIHPWIVASEGVSGEDCCDCSAGAVCRDETLSVA